MFHSAMVGARISHGSSVVIAPRWSRRSCFVQSPLPVVFVEYRGDLYSQSRSLETVARTIAWMAWTTATTTLWPIVLAIGLMSGWRPPWWTAVLAAALVVVEAYLYAGLHDGRYLLPVVLVAVAAVVAGLRVISRPWLAPVAVAILVAIIMAMLGASRDARLWYRRGTAWDTGLAQIRVLMAENPTLPIVLYPTSVGDYEWVFSLRQYMPNGAAMLAPIDVKPRDAFQAKLLDRLSHTPAGDDDVGYVPFDPAAPCIGIVLGKPHATGRLHVLPSAA